MSRQPSQRPVAGQRTQPSALVGQPQPNATAGEASRTAPTVHGAAGTSGTLAPAAPGCRPVRLVRYEYERAASTADRMTRPVMTTYTVRRSQRGRRPASLARDQALVAAHTGKNQGDGLKAPSGFDCDGKPDARSLRAPASVAAVHAKQR
jgi:hypothetical protein